MACITIRNLDNDVRTRLRVRTAGQRALHGGGSAADLARGGQAAGRAREGTGGGNPRTVQTLRRGRVGIAAARADARSPALRLTGASDVRTRTPTGVERGTWRPASHGRPETPAPQGVGVVAATERARRAAGDQPDSPALQSISTGIAKRPGATCWMRSPSWRTIPHAKASPTAPCRRASPRKSRGRTVAFALTSIPTTSPEGALQDEIDLDPVLVAIVADGHRLDRQGDGLGELGMDEAFEERPELPPVPCDVPHTCAEAARRAGRSRGSAASESSRASSARFDAKRGHVGSGTCARAGRASDRPSCRRLRGTIPVGTGSATGPPRRLRGRSDGPFRRACRAWRSPTRRVR